MQSELDNFKSLSQTENQRMVKLFEELNTKLAFCQQERDELLFASSEIEEKKKRSEQTLLREKQQIEIKCDDLSRRLKRSETELSLFMVSFFLSSFPLFLFSSLSHFFLFFFFSFLK